MTCMRVCVRVGGEGGRGEARRGEQRSDESSQSATLRESIGLLAARCSLPISHPAMDLAARSSHTNLHTELPPVPVTCRWSLCGFVSLSLSPLSFSLSDPAQRSAQPDLAAQFPARLTPRSDSDSSIEHVGRARAICRPLDDSTGTWGKGASGCTADDDSGCAAPPLISIALAACLCLPLCAEIISVITCDGRNIVVSAAMKAGRGGRGAAVARQSSALQRIASHLFAVDRPPPPAAFSSPLSPVMSCHVMSCHVRATSAASIRP